MNRSRKLLFSTGRYVMATAMQVVMLPMYSSPGIATALNQWITAIAVETGCHLDWLLSAACFISTRNKAVIPSITTCLPSATVIVLPATLLVAAVRDIISHAAYFMEAGEQITVAVSLLAGPAALLVVAVEEIVPAAEQLVMPVAHITVPAAQRIVIGAHRKACAGEIRNAIQRKKQDGACPAGSEAATPAVIDKPPISFITKHNTNT